MGFNNPAIPWNELRRRMLGEAAQDDAPISRKRPAYEPSGFETRTTSAPQPPLVAYAELHAHSAYSFLDGACEPEQLVEEAVRLGLQALALTDHDGFYGIARFSQAADTLGLPTIFGAELGLDGHVPRTKSEAMLSARSGTPDPAGRHLLVLARDPTGYASLSRAISLAQLRGGTKGHPVYDEDELGELAAGHWLVLTGCRKGAVRGALERDGIDAARRELDALTARFGQDNVAVELTYACDALADERYEALAMLAEERHLPLVASNAAHYDRPERRRLADTMAAIRARSTLDDIDGWLPGWSGAHLRSGDEMAQRFARYPHAVTTAAKLAAECAFKLKHIKPKLPPFDVPAPHADEMAYLRHLTHEGMEERYPAGSEHRAEAYRRLEHELRLIEKLNYPGYFLVVWDIGEFCRENGILCQGRGSAANSVVCYALRVTAVDPVKHHLIFERFLSEERGEAPDIDVDIESRRREEAIQHVYKKHGRHHAAQVANVITYRPRSALRDVAKALGYSPGQQDAWSKRFEHHYWGPLTTPPENDDDAIPAAVLELADELADLPRHLGVHSGGMVMCDRPVIEVCPVEWARKEDRTVLQWDKDDCEHAGLVKFDLLGLGMLSALRYMFDFVEQWYGRKLDLYDIADDDPLVFDMICKADTIGVFQIESRAQMSTLPRLKPRTFYDVVVEIALIRPGPIQGGSVHPYLRRRDGLEEITYPHPSLKPHLERTLGIPLFQEQLMQVAIAVAGFSAGEADELRRAMSNKRSHDKMEALRRRLYEGMAANGITGEVADDIYTRIKSFASYGFPESHSVSFAFLAMASSWLKLYYPAAFLAGLLNAQPMGFYSPQTLVHDARRHGVVVLPPDVQCSTVEAALEGDPEKPAVRLGLGAIRGIGEDVARQVVYARTAGGAFMSMGDLARRGALTTKHLESLATAGALRGLSPSRRAALWNARSAAEQKPERLAVETVIPAPVLPRMETSDQLIADIWATGVSEVYPTALMRDQLDQMGVLTAERLSTVPDRTRVRVGGVVTHRQRPPTAGGITFLSLEDETGLVNVVVPDAVWQRHKRAARDAGGLVIRGMVENGSGAINIVAETITRLPLQVRTQSRDFR
ncbi:MAG TPA: error-prone DNA polymerase [Jatrophihabitans sp.]